MKFLLCLLLLALVVSQSLADGAGATNDVVATILRGPRDVLPARVLMHSVRLHASARVINPQRVVFALPDALSPTASRQLESDGLAVITLDRVPIPRRGSADPPQSAQSLTYAQLFRQTQYRRIVYIAPQMLAKDDVYALARCPVFCAPFISPCSFSTGVLVIEPNQTKYQDLVHSWPSTVCHQNRHDNPDGLDEEACALNEYLGKELLNAPLFSPESGEDLPPDLARGPMMRLPMGCQALSILYYPRLRFEIPKESCGSLRVIDFTGPFFLQPWRWWTYAVLDLSWDWLGYRLQLHDSNGPLDGSRMSICMRIIATVIGTFALLAAWRPWNSTVAPRIVGDDTSPTSSKSAADDQLFLMIAVGRGFGALTFATLVALVVTPETILPLDALVLFVTQKCCLSIFLMIWHGRYCAKHAVPSDADDFPVHSMTRIVSETFAWIVIDCFMVGLVFVFVNLSPVGSGYARLVMIAPYGFTYLFGLMLGLARVSLLWMAWGASQAVAEHRYAKLPAERHELRI